MKSGKKRDFRNSLSEAFFEKRTSPRDPPWRKTVGLYWVFGEKHFGKKFFLGKTVFSKPQRFSFLAITFFFDITGGGFFCREMKKIVSATRRVVDEGRRWTPVGVMIF